MNAPVRICRAPRCACRVEAYDRAGGSSRFCMRHAPVAKAAARAVARTAAVGVRQAVRKRFPTLDRVFKAFEDEVEKERQAPEQREIWVDAEVVK